MSPTTGLSGRVEISRRTLGMAVGDVLLIAAFVVLGELRHDYSVLADPLRVLNTAVPFFVGWAVAFVLGGAYAPRIHDSVRVAAITTALSWIGAALIGVTLRATPVFHGEAPLAFVLVSIGVGLVLLVPWRVVYARRGAILRRFGGVRRDTVGQK